MISGPVRAGFVILTILLSGAASCARRPVRPSTPAAPARIGSEETGIASWYGIPYHGRRTASGEIYDMEKLTAAHRDLPFQTWVEVTNLDNGKLVDVRITDRGPFVGGRIIDLSHRAARDIEMLGPGVVKVRLKVIPPPKDFQEPDRVGTLVAKPTAERPPLPITPEPPARIGAGYAVQAGAFSDRERAEALRTRMLKGFAEARVVQGANNLWIVIVGREMTQEQAADLARRVRQDTGATLVVPEPEIMLQTPMIP